MSINKENYPLVDGYKDFSSASPLYHTLSTFNILRSDTLRNRAPLQPRIILSPNIDPYSPEDCNILSYKQSLVAPGSRTLYANETGKYRSLSDQLKNQQQKAKLFQKGFPLREELISPVGIEPESSSSQPSEPFSESCRDYSPFQVQGEASRNQKPSEELFSDVLYARANEFLDNEGLDLADPADRFGPFSYFTKLRETKSSGGDDDRIIEDLSEFKGVRSATQSPRLISDHICCSTLYQRRVSRSQGPSEEDHSDDPFNSHRPSKLNIFKHFKDDVDQIMMTASPIEEKDTPVLSLNNSQSLGDTPRRLRARRFDSRQLFSPEAAENKSSEDHRPLSSLKMYTVKHSKSFKSPLLDVNSNKQSLIEFSPLRNFKGEKMPSSLGSSPTFVVSKESFQVKDSAKTRKGVVIRKSRFQKLQEFQG